MYTRHLVVNKSSLLLFYINIYIYLILFLIFLKVDEVKSFENQLFILSWCGIILFFISIGTLYFVKKSFLNPYILFYISFSLFQFGHGFLYGLNIEYDYLHERVFYSQFWYDDSNNIILAMKFSVLSIGLFAFGGAINEIKKSSLQKIKKVNYINLDKYLNITGWLLFAISIIPTVYIKISELIFSINNGYHLSTTYSVSIPLGQLHIFFIPSLLLLKISNLNNKFYNFFTTILMLGYSGITILIGDRTSGVAIIVVILLIYMYNTERKYNLKRILIIAISFFLLLSLSNVIADFRNEANRSIGLILTNLFNNNVIVDFIGEAGGTILPLIAIMTIVPSEINFTFGSAYLASIVTILPTSIDPTGFISKAVDLSTEGWLSRYFDLNYGMGYSLNAEAYYNFGWFGLIFIFFLGIFFNKILSFTKEEAINSSAFNMYMKMVLLYSLITLPRRTMSYFFDTYLYYIVVVFLLIKLFQITMKRNK